MRIPTYIWNQKTGHFYTTKTAKNVKSGRFYTVEDFLSAPIFEEMNFPIQELPAASLVSTLRETCRKQPQNHLYITAFSSRYFPLKEFAIQFLIILQFFHFLSSRFQLYLRIN